jgi:hypothetical protein
MMILVRLYLMLAFLASSQLTADQGIDTTVALIQQHLAAHPEDSIDGWNEIMQKAVQRVDARLPLLAEASSIEMAVQMLLSSKSPDKFIVRKREQTRENQPKDLYFAYVGEVGRYVIKVYEARSVLFLTDFWGQWCASQLSLHALEIPLIMTVGKIRVHGLDYFISVENYVSGQS